ncbi:MAG: hypothetical protein Q8M26_01355 [Pseudolabrys sp.]|nr:hypothetical protein [Pseudolabrys sp.]
MSETLRRIQTLVLAGDYLISDHGYDELAKDGIMPVDTLAGITRIVCVARAFSPCNTTAPVGPFTFSGAYRRVVGILRCW